MTTLVVACNHAFIVFVDVIIDKFNCLCCGILFIKVGLQKRVAAFWRPTPYDLILPLFLLIKLYVFIIHYSLYSSRLVNLLFPTFVSICFNNVANMAILSKEIDCQLLCRYLQVRVCVVASYWSNQQCI